MRSSAMPEWCYMHRSAAELQLYMCLGFHGKELQHQWVKIVVLWKIILYFLAQYVFWSKLQHLCFQFLLVLAGYVWEMAPNWKFKVFNQITFVKDPRLLRNLFYILPFYSLSTVLSTVNVLVVLDKVYTNFIVKFVFSL